MGHCSVFDCQIAPGCDQPMEAHADHCSCPECGAVCPGRYDGCPDVWATATVALVPAPRRRGRKRRKAAARRDPVPASVASTPIAWNVEDRSPPAPSNGGAVPANGGGAVPTNGAPAPPNGDTTSGVNSDVAHDRTANEFDEGIGLLRAALADIHHERERLEEPRGLSGTPRARRPRPDALKDDTNGATENRSETAAPERDTRNGKRNGKRNGNGNGAGKGNGWREKQRSEPGTKPVPARRRGRSRTPVDDAIAVGEAKAAPDAAPERDVDVLKAAAAELTRQRDPSGPPPAARQRTFGDAALATPSPAEPKLKKVELPPRAEHTQVAPVPTTGTASTHRRRRGLVAAAILAAVALLAGGLLATSALRDGDSSSQTTSSPRPAPTPARLDLGTFAVVDGVQGERIWTLSGRDGSEFESEITFANDTDAPVAISHTEIIPKSLAASVDQIRFSPEPIVIDPDPVVQFDVTAPANDTVTVQYSIDVPPDGAERSRLADWASDLQDEQRTRGAPVTSLPSLPDETTTTTKPRNGGGSNGGGNGNKPSGGSSPKPAAPPAAAPAPAPPPQPPPPPPAASGTIVIRVVSYDGTGSFGFSGPGGGVSVTTAGSPNGSGQSAAMSVSAGTHAWTQVSLAPGYHLQVIDCTDRDAGPFEQRSTVSGATATFNVQPGETVTCTWINRR